MLLLGWFCCKYWMEPLGRTVCRTCWLAGVSDTVRRSRCLGGAKGLAASSSEPERAGPYMEGCGRAPRPRPLFCAGRALQLGSHAEFLRLRGMVFLFSKSTMKYKPLVAEPLADGCCGHTYPVLCLNCFSPCSASAGALAAGVVADVTFSVVCFTRPVYLCGRCILRI